MLYKPFRRSRMTQVAPCANIIFKPDSVVQYLFPSALASSGCGVVDTGFEVIFRGDAVAAYDIQPPTRAVKISMDERWPN